MGQQDAALAVPAHGAGQCQRLGVAAALAVMRGADVGTALMAVLFAIGVMNVAWMAVIAAVIAIEKLAPWEFHSRLGVAVLLVALGITLALAPAQVSALTIPG